MKKTIIAFFIGFGLFFIPNLKVDASSINSGYSSYWIEGYRMSNTKLTDISRMYTGMVSLGKKMDIC